MTNLWNLFDCRNILLVEGHDSNAHSWTPGMFSWNPKCIQAWEALFWAGNPSPSQMPLSLNEKKLWIFMTDCHLGWSGQLVKDSPVSPWTLSKLKFQNWSNFRDCSYLYDCTKILKFSEMVRHFGTKSFQKFERAGLNSCWARSWKRVFRGTGSTLT